MKTQKRFSNRVSIMKFLDALPADEQDDIVMLFDEMVHDVKSAEASSINNEGYASQFAYLAGAGCLEDVQKILEEAYPRRSNGDE